jgi:hypothetical protein
MFYFTRRTNEEVDPGGVGIDYRLRIRISPTESIRYRTQYIEIRKQEKTRGGGDRSDGGWTYGHSALPDRNYLQNGLGLSCAPGEA